MNKILLFIFLIASLSSCISAKKTTHFQGEISKDSKLHKLKNAPYKLQVNDVLSIGIKTEDPKLVALFSASENSGSLSRIKFIVSGEVGSLGTVNLLQNQISIVEALANAGDIGILGDRKNVQIIRKTIDK